MAFRSGFVSIVGRPNAGKSTLLNALVGEKLAIVTPKPQTTRARIQGILNLKAEKGRPAAQVVFVDTPGVHRPDSRLNRKMLQEIHEALECRDLLLLILDASQKFSPADQETLELIKRSSEGHRSQLRGDRKGAGHRQQGTGHSGGDSTSDFSICHSEPTAPGEESAFRSPDHPITRDHPISQSPNRSDHPPTFLLLNKIDKVEKQTLLPLIEHYRKLHDFQEIIPISATRRQGLDLLLDKIVHALPDGPRYFPEDQLTDQPERFLASEIIREKVLLKTSQELPYATAVMIDRYEELEKLTRIAATIYCEREGQKGILIGRRGERLKEIGAAARLDLERLLGKKVFLELFVKVKADWKESASFIQDLDWRREP